MIELKPYKSMGVMTTSEFADYLKYSRYRGNHRIVIEPREGGLVDVHHFDAQGNELGG